MNITDEKTNETNIAAILADLLDEIDAEREREDVLESERILHERQLIEWEYEHNLNLAA